MQFDLRTVTLAPSSLTYGALASAVLASSVAAWLLGRRLSPTEGTPARGRAIRMVGLVLAGAATLPVTAGAYVSIVGVIVPGACTYFAGPTLPSLALPPLALAAGAASRFTWYARARTAILIVLSAVVWLGSLEATSTLASENAYLEASRRHGVTARQEINHEHARIVLPDASRAIPTRFNPAAVRLRSGASRDEVRSLLGEPSDEGADPGVVASLVGIAPERLDASAFRYMRYLYSDGSYTVLVIDAFSDRVVSQVMAETTLPPLPERMAP